MNNELYVLGDMIVSKKYEIAKAVHEARYSGIELTAAQQHELKKMEEKIIDIRANFIGLFGEALMDHTNKEKGLETIFNWGKETGEYVYNLGTSLDEALMDTSYYREHIWNAIKETAVTGKMPASTIFDVIAVIDPLLDRAIYSFSLTFVKSHQKNLEHAKTALLELSVPVVPLMPGVGVLPLVGNVDTERAQLLMEETLAQAVNLKLTHLIFDISGVMIVDTMVADQLFKVISALSLVGVKTIMTGIRPEVAHTMVTLGLNLEGITIKANLHQAFKEIQLLQNK